MKNWNWGLIVALLFCVLIWVCLLSGCAEPYAAGFATGAVVMEEMADDVEADFLVALHDLKTTTAALAAKKEAVENIRLEDFIRPETIEAVKELKGREEDPVTWVALASILANIFWAGKTHEKKKVAVGLP